MEYKNRTIDIFGTKWKLKFTDKIEIEGNENILGLTDYTNGVISIVTKLPKEEVSITILHELIHAILNSGQYLDYNKDEPLVEFIARSLHSLIKLGVLQWKF